MSNFDRLDAWATQKGIIPPSQKDSMEKLDAWAVEKGLMKKQEPETNMTRLIGERLLSGAIGLADLPQVVAGLAKSGMQTIGLPGGQLPERMASDVIKQKLREKGLNLETEEARTPLERVAGHGAEFAGSLIGGGLLGTAAKGLGAVKAGKFLGAPQAKTLPGKAVELGKLGTLGAGIGATSGLAQEVGVNPLIADIGSAIALPAGIAGLKKGVGRATKATKYFVSPAEREAVARAAGQEEAAQYLQNLVGQESIPKVLENLESYQSPIGFKGTTAERAKNVGLAQLERAKAGQISEIAEQRALDNEAIRQALERLAPEGADILATKGHFEDIAKGLEQEASLAKEALEPQIHPEQAGETLRGALVSNLEKLKKQRHEVTHPLYEKVREIKEGVQPLRTHAMIDEELKIAKGPIKNELLNIKGMLEPNVKELGLDQVNKFIKEQELHGAEKFSPEAIKKLRASTSAPTPIELKNTRGVISDKIRAATIRGDAEEARLLSKVKEALNEDLAVIPEEAEATRLYSELSRPISALEEHRAIGKIVEKDVYKQNFLIGPAEIPSKVINSSKSSIKDAEDLLKQIGKDKKSIEAVEGYINYDVINHITDNFGNVDVKKLDAWKKSNEGAFKLYPHLKTKLSNLRNAQHMVNQVHLKGMKEADSYFKGAFQSFMGENPDHIIRNIFSGRNPSIKFDKVLEVASQDKSGDSLEGIKRAIINDVKRNTNVSSLDTKGLENVSYHKFNGYLEKNSKNLAKVFNSDQMQVFNSINDALKRRQFASSVGTPANSITSSNLSILNAIENVPSNLMRKTIGKFLGLQGIDTVVDFLKKYSEKAKINAKNELINRALVDTETAKLLLTPLKDKDQAKTIVEKLQDKSFLMFPAFLNKPKEDEE